MNRIHIRHHLPGFELNVAIDVPPARITAIYGPSGSGKTTLLRATAGLEQADRALVEINGHVLEDTAAGIRIPTWKRRLGYVFQESSLFAHLNVKDNIEYGLRRRADATGSTDEAIELLGIGHLLRRSVDGLSGGERQRVAIARALACAPQLLLLDEPLASLDPQRRQDILPWLERLRDHGGVPMLYVTHAMEEVAQLADHLVVLEAGRVKAQGQTSAVLGNLENPVIRGDGVGVILPAWPLRREPEWGLQLMRTPAGTLWSRMTDTPHTGALKVCVLARDVSLTLSPPEGTSILNVLPGHITGFADDQHVSQLLVRVRCEDTELIARITRRSAHLLQLETGTPVWLQVKAIALLGA